MMIESLITSMPMNVCLILTFLIGLSLIHEWDRPKFKLLLFMVTATLLYTGHYIFFNRVEAAIPVSDTIYSFCNLAVYPLYFMYIEELTQHRPDYRRQAFYLLPSVVGFLAVGTLYLLMDENETQLFVHHLFGNKFSTLTGLAWWQGVVHMAAKIVFALQIPPILVIGWRHITDYNRLIENNYADTEDKMLSRIKTLLILFVIAAVVSFVCNIIGRISFVDSLWLLAVPSAFFSTLILLIGHIGLQQRFYIQDIEEEALEPDASPALLTLPKEEVLRERICQLVEEEKLYLRPNLKINDLAQLLNTNRNYIYQAINVGMGISFSDFINQKRIEHAKQAIEDNPHILLAEIAAKSGFSSTSTFYRNFKQIEGYSPSDFQQQALESTPTANRTRN